MRKKFDEQFKAQVALEAVNMLGPMDRTTTETE